MRKKQKNSNRSWRKHAEEKRYGFWTIAAHNMKNKQ